MKRIKKYLDYTPDEVEIRFFGWKKTKTATITSKTYTRARRRNKLRTMPPGQSIGDNSAKRR